MCSGGRIASVCARTVEAGFRNQRMGRQKSKAASKKLAKKEAAKPKAARKRVVETRATGTKARKTDASIRIKRVYDPPGAEDGLRILIDRLWPRGVAKSRLKLDAWP